MTAQLNFLCPHHGESEQIEIPDDYLVLGNSNASYEFKGEMRCGNGDSLPLKLHLRFSGVTPRIESIERA